MILKRKNKSAAANPAESGKDRSILSYFMPFMIVGVLLIAVVAFGVRWLVLDDAQKQLSNAIEGIATGIKNHAQTVVESKLAQLRAVTGDAEVLEALATTDETQLAMLTNRMHRQLAGALRVRLVPGKQSEEELQREFSDSFAAKDMFYRAVRNGVAPPAEALRGEGDSIYFIMALPVKNAGGEVAGVAMASYSMDIVDQGLAQTDSLQGALGLEQVAGGGAFLLFSTAGFADGGYTRQQPVKGTLWRVRYGVDYSGGRELMFVGGLALLAIVVLLVVVRQQKNSLSTDLKTDMGMAVSLMDATVKRKGTPSFKPKISECKPAIELMTKYAQAAYTAGKVTEEKNVAGMPSKVTEPADTKKEGAEAPAKAEQGPKEIPESIWVPGGILTRVGETMSHGSFQKIGQAIGTMALQAGDESVFVGRDNRLSSNEWESALVAGILAAGCDVVDLGVTPAPIINFATNELSSSSGIMVGGGYSPPNYNGVRIIIGGTPLVGPSLQKLRDLVISGEFNTGTGVLSDRNVSAEYIRHVVADVQVAEPRKVVVDGGNGVAGQVTVRLLQALDCEVIELFCEPDGNFPNHLPDPSDPDNLASLILEVQAQGADLGIAIGGDGTRIGVVDAEGRHLSSDLLIMAFASDIIGRHPGADVVYDVSCTGNLAGHILSVGGRPIMWKGEPTEILAKMKETGALLGGQFAGNLYIRDRWFAFDDGVYAAARLLEILGSDNMPVADYFDGLPRSLGTPELSIEIGEGEGPALVEKMLELAEFPNADVLDIDGLRIEFANGWGLIRADETLPRLICRFEGDDEMALNQVKESIRKLIQDLLPQAQLPF